ncbi:MAG: GDP-mannose 4,6-dehydratase, partial [Bacteroidota bacterium]
MSTQHTPRVVLVTGGAGFIGANFLLRMVPRYPDVQFVNLDALTYAGNPMTLQPIEDAANYSFIHGDIADGALVQRLFEEHGFSTVAHFAAESHVDRSILDP